jgi:C4-dicarboxylate transporter DctQ subunit
MDSSSSNKNLPDCKKNVRSSGLRSVLERIAKVANVLAVGFLLLLLAVVFTMVLARNLMNWGLGWLDDLARYVQVWAVYTAAVSITMNGEHITMDAVYVLMSKFLQRMMRIFIGLLSLFFCALTGYLALQQTLDVIKIGEVSSTGVFPAFIGYASLPVGLFLMGAASLHYLLYIAPLEDFRSTA